MRCRRCRAGRVEQAVDRADEPRHVDEQEEREEDRRDEAQHDAECGEREAEHSTERRADRLRELLHALLRLLGPLAVLVDPGADRRVADVLHDRGQRVDEVAHRSTNGAIRRIARTIPSTTSPSTTIVEDAPRPNRDFRSRRATTGSRTSATKSARNSVRIADRMLTNAQPMNTIVAARSSVRNVIETLSGRRPGVPGPEACAASTVNSTRPGISLLRAVARAGTRRARVRSRRRPRFPSGSRAAARRSSRSCRRSSRA